MRQTQVRLDHAGPQRIAHRIGLQRFGLFQSFVGICHAVGAVNLFGDQFDSLSKRRFQFIEELEVIRLLARVNHRFGQFDRAFAALEPVLRNCGYGSVLLGDPAHNRYLVFGVRVEAIDTNDRRNAALLDRFDMGYEVLAALFDQREVLSGVLLR